MTSDPQPTTDSKGPTDADTQQAEDKRARGELTAENIRYGEAISEHGMGGETMAGGIGVASQGALDLSGCFIGPGAWRSSCLLTCLVA